MKLLKSSLNKGFTRTPKSLVSGFTLTELVVAVAIFAFVVTAMMSMLNYTLKINRKTEAVRQATQSIRNFVEFIAKELRNGRIDYSTDGAVAITSVTPCPYPITISGNVLSDTYGPGLTLSDSPYPAGTFGSDYIDSYSFYHDYSDTHLGIINSAGERECFFWGKTISTAPNKDRNVVRNDGSGSVDYTDDPVCSYGRITGAACTDGVLSNGETLDSLFMTKDSVSGAGSVQIINPKYVTIDFLRFYIRPLHDPYTSHTSGSDDRPDVQPLVTMLMRFTVTLPSGEKVVVPYQTTISSDDYGVPK
jgi:prepilin-type N-terminal cleavage/methylation domain-containing protein